MGVDPSHRRTQEYGRETAVLPQRIRAKRGPRKKQALHVPGQPAKVACWRQSAVHQSRPRALRAQGSQATREKAWARERLREAGAHLQMADRLEPIVQNGVGR